MLLKGFIILLLISAIAGWEHHRVTAAYERGHTAAVQERAQTDAKAVITRTGENAATATKQTATNVVITKAKNEELSPVVARARTDRVRVGPAFCGGPSPTAQTASPAGGDRADPPGRLVQPEIERDIVALKIEVETDLATGRSCQAFLEKNGLVP